MADTAHRWTCGCGSFRFKIDGVDRRVCQQCGLITKKQDELWFAVGKEKE